MHMSMDGSWITKLNKATHTYIHVHVPLYLNVRYYCGQLLRGLSLIVAVYQGFGEARGSPTLIKGEFVGYNIHVRMEGRVLPDCLQ